MNKEVYHHCVANVDPASLAKRMGVQIGDCICSINQQPLIDEIDYQYLSTAKDIALTLIRRGQEITLYGCKEEGQALGIVFQDSLMGATRLCVNQCIFCFVDQMAPALRSTLYVKDDDWRLSLTHGQYITLTNVSDQEFARMIARQASPLYISVHATDPAVRSYMMGQPLAEGLMERLKALHEAKLHFHAQIVLCSGINDALVLENTLKDLASLAPSACSVAVVPVGLTKYRENLPTIPPFTKESARKVLAQLHAMQIDFLSQMGTRFVFASDEFYCLAQEDPPGYDAYETFPQIENGVGMLRKLEEEYLYAWEELPHDAIKQRHIAIACGVSVADFLRKMIREHPIPKVEVDILPIKNTFFGELVTVSGLLTGGDLIAELGGKRYDEILFSASMLRQDQDVFLDDTTLAHLAQEIPIPMRAIPPDGEELALAIAGLGGTK